MPVSAGRKRCGCASCRIAKDIAGCSAYCDSMGKGVFMRNRNIWTLRVESMESSRRWQVDYQSSQSKKRLTYKYINIPTCPFLFLMSRESYHNICWIVARYYNEKITT